MQKLSEFLQHLLHCIEHHRDYGDLFDYEDFARESFKKKGKGFIWIDASDWVRKSLEGKASLVNLDYKYVAFEEYTPPSSALDMDLRTVIDHDPANEYAIVLMTDRCQLPVDMAAQMPDQFVYALSTLSFTKASRPSRITSSQIKKRLNRMVQEGIRLIVLDTSQPDYMGANLEKWMSEIKRLQAQGKQIAAIIDSVEESDVQIPESLQQDVVPLRFGEGGKA